MMWMSFFSAQYTDLEAVSRATKRIKVFAQHIDPISAGRGIGAVLPEAVREAGAVGVLLNHAEKPMTLYDLESAIIRARECGLISLVCAGTAEQGAAVACLKPDIVLAESPLLIGAGRRSREDMKEVDRINQMIHLVDPEISVLHGAGIADAQDVYEVIRAGADATGSTSGIFKSADPEAMIDRMIGSVARAWKERNCGFEQSE